MYIYTHFYYLYIRVKSVLAEKWLTWINLRSSSQIWSLRCTSPRQYADVEQSGTSSEFDEFVYSHCVVHLICLINFHCIREQTDALWILEVVQAPQSFRHLQTFFFAPLHICLSLSLSHLVRSTYNHSYLVASSCVSCFVNSFFAWFNTSDSLLILP